MDNEKFPPHTIALYQGQEVFVHKIDERNPNKRLLSYNWSATGWYEHIDNIQPVIPLKFFTPGEQPAWYGVTSKNENHARAENSGITKEDRERLVILIDRVKLGEDTHLIHQFFNQLLAAKDARITQLEAQIHNDATVKEAMRQVIAALESRQITPEMMEHYYKSYGDNPHESVMHTRWLELDLQNLLSKIARSERDVP